MRKIIVIAGIMVLPWLTACRDGGGGDPLSQPGAAVHLEGSIGMSTRGVIGSGYDKDLELGFARRDETAGAPGTYGAWTVFEAVRQGGAGSRPITFTQPQLYPFDGRRISLHGYYPAGAESDADPQTGKTLFYIDGATDILATGCLTASVYNPVRSCTLRHLLTQVALVCYSDRPEQWGTVVKIEAAGIPLAQELDWQQETPQLVAASGSPVGKVEVQDIAGLVLPQAGGAEYLPEAQGYILLPVSSSDGTTSSPLQLEVTTSKDGRGVETPTLSQVSVSVEGGFQAGSRHQISLFFTEGCQIEAVSVSVEQWTDRETVELPL